MFCTDDCCCSLCRELRGCKVKTKPMKPTRNSKLTRNDNFILKKRLTDFKEMENAYNTPAIVTQQKNFMKKSQSYNEIPGYAANVRNSKFNGKIIKSTTNLLEEEDEHPLQVASNQNLLRNKIERKTDHKVVIYFGDSISNKKFDKVLKPPTPPMPPQIGSDLNVFHAKKLFEEITPLQFKRQTSVVSLTKEEEKEENARKPKNDVLKQLKSVLEEKNKGLTPVKEPEVAPMQPKETVQKCDKVVATEKSQDKSLPSFVDSVINGVINIKIEGSYKVASEIVQAVHSKDDFDDCDQDFGDLFDWSFVQDWRARYFMILMNLYDFKIL